VDQDIWADYWQAQATGAANQMELLYKAIDAQAKASAIEVHQEQLRNSIQPFDNKALGNAAQRFDGAMARNSLAPKRTDRLSPGFCDICGAALDRCKCPR
jgi:hypothetical protein